MVSPTDMRDLLALYEEVVRALDAGVLTRAAAGRAPQPGPGGKLLVLGLGKVASEMVSALPGKRNAIVVVPIDAPAPPGARILRGGHPLPDAGSLEAGGAPLPPARPPQPGGGGAPPLPRGPLKPGNPADFIEHEAICDLRSPAQEAARRAGARMLDSPVRGTVETFAEALARERGFICASGELEVRVPSGAPPGGRDQHLALLMALELRGEPGAAFLAAGTDGRDGPTAAAGAMVDGSTWEEAERPGLQPARARAELDAGRVLSPLGLLIPARHTGAHAGDLFLLRR